jgi:hypothetical protein
MNFNMGDVANALKLKAADSVIGGVQKVTETAASTAGAVAGVAGAARRSAAKKAAGKKAGAAAAKGVVDPLQWWGALTQQFQEIAGNAMKDATQKTAVDAARNMATGVAKEAMKAATGMGKAAVGSVAAAGRKKAPAAKTTRARKTSR